MKKLSELTISEEEISNDVIDVSKECGKLDESIDLLHDNPDSLVRNGNQINYQYKQSKIIALNKNDDLLLIGDEPKIKHIYQNNNSNRISTDSVIYSSPKIELKNSQIIDQDLLYGTNDTKKTNANFSTFQNNCNKSIYSTIANNTTNNNKTFNQLNRALNNSNTNLNANSSPKIDNFTSKLPPVPRRNSKTLLNQQNFNSNLSNMPKQLNASLKYVGASNTNLSFSSPVFVNNTDEYYQSIDINNSKLKNNVIHKNDSDDFDKQTSQIKINQNNRNLNSNYYQKI